MCWVSCPLPAPEEINVREPMLPAFKGFVSDYLQDFWYIVRLTVPLMFLAGFLGALAATFIPPELIADLKFSIPVALAAAVVGTFMPVPIAFDVVVTGALLSGVDLTRTQSDQEMAQLRRALLDHLVIFFRDQDISKAQHVAFGRAFGELC